ncbi:SLC13 family permease [Pseudonocardia xishanensis]|uniref:CitMHS family transporter n=1 Tax=Pseudonocardia xishanensis TaxID=630995 RepID=A0ABP8S1Z1_9PSEU
MLAWLGLATIVVFTALVMAKRLSAVAALVLVPTVFGLVGGFGGQLGDMMVSGIVDTAPTAVLLTFALLFFLVMTEAGLFEPLVRRILAVVGDDPVRIAMGTAVLCTFLSIDGDGSTAAFVVITSMYPIYRQVGMNPIIIALVLAMISPTMNWLPWGGPAARMATSLRIDIADVVIPMLPALVLTVLGAYVLVYVLGRRERRRINALKAVPVGTRSTVDAGTGGGSGGSADDTGPAGPYGPDTPADAAADVDVVGSPRVPIPTRYLWFNLTLTIAFIASMAIELLPLPALAMIAFSIAVTVNWPNLKVQNEKLKPHMGTVVTVISLILAAGAFSGIINETGMVSAMADGLVTHLPEAWGGAFAFVTALSSGPLLFILSNDSFYFGVVPILAEAGAAFHIPPEVIAHSVLPGIYLHTLSPLSAPIYLVVALLRTDFGAVQRFAAPWLIAITLIAIAAAAVTGAVYVV